MKIVPPIPHVLARARNHICLLLRVEDVEPLRPPTFVSAANVPSGRCALRTSPQTAALSASMSRRLAANAPLVPCFAEDTLSEIEPFLQFRPAPVRAPARDSRVPRAARSCLRMVDRGGTELRDPEDGECRDPHEYEECSEKDRRFHVRQSLFGVTTRFRKYATVQVRSTTQWRLTPTAPI